jgi:hypothetical protein
VAHWAALGTAARGNEHDVARRHAAVLFSGLGGWDDADFAWQRRQRDEGDQSGGGASSENGAGGQQRFVLVREACRATRALLLCPIVDTEALGEEPSAWDKVRRLARD